MDGPFYPCLTVTSESSPCKVFFDSKDASDYAATLEKPEMREELGFVKWDPQTPDAVTDTSKVWIVPSTVFLVSGNQTLPHN